MDVKEVLSQFECARRSGDGWIALCPAHDDSNPSLSVAEGRNGRILLHCFAGCDPEEVAQAIGLDLSDLAPENGPSPGYSLTDYAEAQNLPAAELRRWGVQTVEQETGSAVAIPYRNRSGDTAGLKLRAGDHFWWDEHAEIPYGLDRLSDADEGQSVLLVEGESDCHACWHHNVLTIGVPGANSWRSEWSAQLADRTVYVWQEPDEGGDQFVRAVTADLPSALVIEAPDEAEDPAELHLWAPDGFRNRMAALIETAAKRIAGGDNDTPSRELWSDAPSVTLSTLYPLLDGAGIDYDLRPYTARGRFALLSGRPKSGKSTWATVYAHAKATGEPFIGQRLDRGTVLYVAPDENWRDVVRRFRSFGTPGDRVQVWGPREYSVSSIARRVREIGADLVVLDTLLRVAGIEDENDNAAWDAWFSEAREHVHESRAAWLALHHEKKGGGKDGEGIRGASAIFGSVDVAASLKPSDDSPHRRTLQVEGTRLDHAEPLVIELNAGETRYKAVGESEVVSILEDATLARLREVLSAEARTVAEIHKALSETYPEAEEDVAQSTVRNRLNRLRSAGLALRSGEGGRRDPYKYALNRSDGGDETTESHTQPTIAQDDTRSTTNPETRNEGRTLNRSGPLMGPERLSDGPDECGDAGEVDPQPWGEDMVAERSNEGQVVAPTGETTEERI